MTILGPEIGMPICERGEWTDRGVPHERMEKGGGTFNIHACSFSICARN